MEIGRLKKVESGKEARAVQLGVMSQNDTTPDKPVSTRVEIARAAGVSTGQVGMADLIVIGAAKYDATVGRPSKESLSQNDNDLPEPKHNTRIEIAKAASARSWRDRRRKGRKEDRAGFCFR